MKLKRFDEFKNENTNVLLAPNGKLSNLNEFQWEQVRTPEFIEWFGDSKVIDENGEPMVVYHGSNNEKFDIFDPKKGNPCLSGGIYFSNSKYFAKKFTSDKNNVVYSVFLKIENPTFGYFTGSGCGTEISKSEYRDGGIFTKKDTDGYAEMGTKEYVIFEPNQIKSATDNNGNFNKNNPNINENKKI